MVHSVETFVKKTQFRVKPNALGKRTERIFLGGKGNKPKSFVVSAFSVYTVKIFVIFSPFNGMFN
tara:strand:- start:1146 stop:1340 length:195 start_codon:yes stop_codon:yes gene_type:complete